MSVSTAAGRWLTTAFRHRCQNADSTSKAPPITNAVTAKPIPAKPTWFSNELEAYST